MPAPPEPEGGLQDPDPPDLAQALRVTIVLLRDLREYLTDPRDPTDPEDLAGRAWAVRRVLVRVLARHEGES